MFWPAPMVALPPQRTCICDQGRWGWQGWRDAGALRQARATKGPRTIRQQHNLLPDRVRGLNGQSQLKAFRWLRRPLPCQLQYFTGGAAIDLAHIHPQVTAWTTNPQTGKQNGGDPGIAYRYKFILPQALLLSVSPVSPCQQLCCASAIFASTSSEDELTRKSPTRRYHRTPPASNHTLQKKCNKVCASPRCFGCHPGNAHC